MFVKMKTLMKNLYTIIIGLTSLVIVSCSAPVDERATAVCDCYKVLHSLDPVEKTEEMNVVADSCKKLHVGILKELEGNAEEKAKFDEAYNYCQNEK